MTAKAAAKKPTEENIISAYMNFVLENETVPKSVFKFCRENKIKEEEFYKLFGSVGGIQKAIWDLFLPREKRRKKLKLPCESLTGSFTLKLRKCCYCRLGELEIKRFLRYWSLTSTPQNNS